MNIQSNGKAGKRERICLENLPEECQRCQKKGYLEIKFRSLNLFVSHFYFLDMELERCYTWNKDSKFSQGKITMKFGSPET